MKTSARLLALAIILIFSSCEKVSEPAPPVTGEEATVRLKGIDEPGPFGSSLKRRFVYDTMGRIIQVMSQIDSNAFAVDFDIIYNGNEIIMASPTHHVSYATTTDTTSLYLDATKRVVLRTRKTFVELKTSIPIERKYQYDTTFYEYDTEGLMKKEIYHNTDSTWYDHPVSPSSVIIRSTAVKDYTNLDGNVVRTSEISTMTTVTRQDGALNTSAESLETTKAYEYPGAFPNKTDFTNAIILHDMALFDFPFNANYRNLPEVFRSTYIQKDQNGTIVSTDQSDYSQQFTFNSSGFLATKSIVGSPNSVTTYLYTK
jgi:hypothetical protein